jgi:SAM-dependent methyltransferase
MTASAASRFRSAYGAHRASEGRDLDPASMRQLPYLAGGPLAKQWAVRARTFDAFVRRIVRPMARRAGRPLRLLDLGAGNGWLSWRAALDGHAAVALDVRGDHVDGLGAADAYLASADGRLHRVIASFESLPLAGADFDLVVFNASLHYALDLAATLREARRVARPGGRIVILDSAFYARDADGEQMLMEKRREATARFGERADVLLSLPFIEYLTPARLDAASRQLGLSWTRHRVRYPLWYELRPLAARLRRRRAPSRFDLWEATVS